MPLRTRVWSLGKLLVLLGALVTTYFVFAAVGMRVALRAREVQVPSLIGQPVSDATLQLTASGLTMRVDDNQRSDPRIPAGRIMQQDPPAGVQMRRQRAIRVWLSAGVRAATVPALTGQTERTARLQLEQDQLAVGSVTEVRSPDYPADVVVAQNPAPSAPGDTVSLLVNRGEQMTTFVMPDLIGLDAVPTADALRARGFRVTIVGQQPYPGMAPGTVVRQQPPSGFQVAPADPISLEVSR